MAKSILTLDEINLLLNSEEPKNSEIYGNIYEVLIQLTNLKAVTIEELKLYHLNKVGQAALTYNKKSLIDNVKGEWFVESDSSEDTGKKVRCGLCNTPNKYLFFIRNRLNNIRLNVGSSCMTKFPGIEGYTEYKYHLNKVIKNQHVIKRRTEFHKKFPNVFNILDSANFYFDNLPILLPYELYYELKNTIKNMRLIYSQFVNKGLNINSSTQNVFEAFSTTVSRYNNLKKQADEFVAKNKYKLLSCKRKEIDWLIIRKQTKLLDEIAMNQGEYSIKTIGKIISQDFIKKNLYLFSSHNSSTTLKLNDLKENSQLSFFVVKRGYAFLYIIDLKKFMNNIGAYCFFDINYTYKEKDLFDVSEISFTESNFKNATDSIIEILSKFGFLILMDDSSQKMYIYKKVDKSVKEYTVTQFLKIYSSYYIKKANDFYRFIAILTFKDWISQEEQRKQGIDSKINKLYYQQHIEPYL